MKSKWMVLACILLTTYFIERLCHYGVLGQLFSLLYNPVSEGGLHIEPEQIGFIYGLRSSYTGYAFIVCGFIAVFLPQRIGLLLSSILLVIGNFLLPFGGFVGVIIFVIMVGFGESWFRVSFISLLGRCFDRPQIQFGLIVAMYGLLNVTGLLGDAIDLEQYSSTTNIIFYSIILCLIIPGGLVVLTKAKALPAPQNRGTVVGNAFVILTVIVFVLSFMAFYVVILNGDKYFIGYPQELNQRLPEFNASIVIIVAAVLVGVLLKINGFNRLLRFMIPMALTLSVVGFLIAWATLQGITTSYSTLLYASFGCISIAELFFNSFVYFNLATFYGKWSPMALGVYYGVTHFMNEGLRFLIGNLSGPQVGYAFLISAILLSGFTAIWFLFSKRHVLRAEYGPSMTGAEESPS